MNYNWSFDKIKKEYIKCIFELGANDCLDSLTLCKEFNCPIFSFECNPDCIKECRKTIETNKNYPITLIEKAVHEENNIVQFRPFNRDKYDNIAASSLFEIDFITNRSINDVDYGKTNVQSLITVDAIRLDKYIDDTGYKPDLICMDIQEAELIALRGLGDKIRDVKYIIFEASLTNTYTGGCNFNDVDNYLKNNNFVFVKSNLVNGEYPSNKSNKYYYFFDCVYVNNSIIS